MVLKEKIQQDLNTALKKKEELKSSVFRLLLAAILNKEKEKRYKLSKDYYPPTALPPERAPKPELKEEELIKKSQLTDEEVIEVISSETKKRKESILEFEKGRLQPTLHPARKKHIMDLVDKEKKELEILQKYLPEQLPEEEIKKLAKEAIEKVGAKEPKDMGKVMAELMPKVKGRADGSLVNKIVKELLGS